MKICKQCKIEKQSGDFYGQKQRGKNNKVWFYLDSLCKECRVTYGTERRQEIKNKIVEYLGGECYRCKIKYKFTCIYDCHHLDGSTKSFTIAKSPGKSFEAIKKELDKCILLCANCHRIEEYCLIQKSF